MPSYRITLPSHKNIFYHKPEWISPGAPTCDVRNKISAHTNTTENLSNMANKSKMPAHLDATTLATFADQVSPSYSVKALAFGEYGL